MSGKSCPNCWKDLQYLEESKTWYCLACDRKFAPSTEDPSKLEEVFEKYPIRNLRPDQEEKLVKQYEILYIDGLKDMWGSSGTLSILPDSILIFLDHYRFEQAIPYNAIEVLNVLQERDITALRTFLLGPVLAAAFKKKSRIITIGFRDELGLLQLPSFKTTSDLAIEDCYKSIVTLLKVFRQHRT